MKFLIPLSLIISFTATTWALPDRQRYPTCAVFSDDLRNTQAAIKNEDLQARIQQTEILFIAESHSSADFDNVIPWIKSTIESQHFDCLLLELPVNVAANEDQQFTGEISSHPFLQLTGKESEARKPWLTYLNALITTSHQKGLKIFHIDLSEDKQKENIKDFLGGIVKRNDFMARSIKKLIDSKTCRKTLVQNGMGHITSSYYVNTSFKTRTVPSIPQHPAIKDRTFVSVNISNSLFDYLVPESLDLCFGLQRGYFIDTEKLETNMAYSSQMGKLKDFNYILVPNTGAK